jgi:hypothetical protein
MPDPRTRLGLARLCAASVLCAATLLASCRAAPVPRSSPFRPSAEEEAFLDTLQARTFRYFWELSDPVTGLTPDRAPTPSFASTGADGFALTAYGIGAERGYVPRAEARARTLKLLRFLWRARQDTARVGATGYRGFFYHFLEPRTGRRFERVELSTMDTALLMAGALFSGCYFDGDHPEEVEIRTLAESLYRRVDWRWAQARPPTIALAWDPEEGFPPYDWRGYNEAMILHLLALGSPTHPVTADAWDAWLSGYRWGVFEGVEQVGFAPLFGHQYTQCWLDLRGLRDAYVGPRGLDYFENSRRATYSQRAYAVRNPGRWRGYGPDLWGLTACDGPADTVVILDGRKRQFRTYAARGASFTEVEDDGTLAPAAAGGSLAFAPEIALPALMAMKQRYDEQLFSTYGFVDAFNPTLTLPIRTHHGHVVAGVGWFDTDHLGIDQGPILLMAENLRSGLVWERMKRCPHVVRGLRRAGFTGGWLERARAAP